MDARQLVAAGERSHAGGARLPERGREAPLHRTVGRVGGERPRRHTALRSGCEQALRG